MVDNLWAGPVPIVGRDHELEYLQAALGQAINGDGSSIFISGSMGSGKSRILEEIRKLCKNLDCYHFTGIGILSDRILLYPWLEIADNILASEWVSGTGKAYLSHFKKGVAEWNEENRVNLADMGLAVSSLTPHRAVVLLLDDVHRFDEASLGLLMDMVRQVHGTKALILATYDTDGGENPVFDQMLSSLREENLAHELPPARAKHGRDEGADREEAGDAGGQTTCWSTSTAPRRARPCMPWRR